VPGIYIVDLRDGTNFRQEAERLAAEYGFTLRSVFDAVLGGFSAEMSATAVASVRCERVVEAVYSNAIFSLGGTAVKNDAD